jgi:hypothetical protein
VTKIIDLKKHLITCDDYNKKSIILNENNAIENSSQSDKNSLKLSSLNDIESINLNESNCKIIKKSEIDNKNINKNEIKSNSSSSSIEIVNINKNADKIFEEYEDKKVENICTLISKEKKDDNLKLKILEKKVKVLEKSN